MKLNLVDLGRVSIETRGLNHGQDYERITPSNECIEPVDGFGTGDWDAHPVTGLCTIN